MKNLQLVLTSRCNLSCSYCYQNRKSGDTISWESIQSSLDVLLASGPAPIGVIFTGGEPLLEFSLIRRAVEYVRCRRPEQGGVEFAINTNGTLIDRDVTCFLTEHRFKTQLSFDGVPASQNLREAGSFGGLDALLTKLRRDEAEYFRDCLSINLTLTEHNLTHLADSVDYLLLKGVEDLSITSALTHQVGWTPDRIGEMESQFDRLLANCLDRLTQGGGVVVNVFKPRPPRSSNGAMCNVGRCELMTVDTDGRVHGCTTFIPRFQAWPTGLFSSNVSHLEVGSINGPELAHRLTAYTANAAGSPMLTNKRRKRSSYDRCEECQFVKECVLCPASIGHIPGNSDPDLIPDFQCAFQRVSTAARKGFLRLSDPFKELRAADLAAAEQNVLDFATAWNRHR